MTSVQFADAEDFPHTAGFGCQITYERYWPSLQLAVFLVRPLIEHPGLEGAPVLLERFWLLDVQVIQANQDEYPGSSPILPQTGSSGYSS
jgi:hypothetical protein